jgi:hypothetical protein
MATPMTIRLPLFFALLLAMLLPANGALAAINCLPVAARATMDHVVGGCDDCSPGASLRCDMDCPLLCQPLWVEPHEDLGTINRSALTLVAGKHTFLQLARHGPEPPPPRFHG